MINTSKLVSRATLSSLALLTFAFAGCNIKTGEAAAPSSKKAAVVASSPKKSVAVAANSQKEAATTVACSNAISSKATLPSIVAGDVSYRPLFNISATMVSGQGDADNNKLSKVGNAFSACVFVDPEIFKGLSPMQSLALREAVVDVCKKSEADFLIAPRWEFKVTSNGDDVTFVSCVVTGFPAKIVGFEKIDDWQQKLADKDAEIETLKSTKDAEIEAVKNAKNAEIAAIKKAWEDERTREKKAGFYLQLMKEYDVKTMEDVRRLCAMMGEVLPVDPDERTISIKAGEMTSGCLNGKPTKSVSEK